MTAPESPSPLALAFVKLCRDQPLSPEETALVLAHSIPRIKNEVMGSRPYPGCACAACAAARFMGIGDSPPTEISGLLAALAKGLGGTLVSVERVEIAPPEPRDDGAAPPLRPADVKPSSN